MKLLHNNDKPPCIKCARCKEFYFDWVHDDYMESENEYTYKRAVYRCDTGKRDQINNEVIYKNCNLLRRLFCKFEENAK